MWIRVVGVVGDNVDIDFFVFYCIFGNIWPISTQNSRKKLKVPIVNIYIYKKFIYIDISVGRI